MAVARAGTATSISGLYITGVDNSGASLTDGAQDGHWTTGGAGAYVVTSLPGGWMSSPTKAEWVTPSGGPMLPNTTYAYTISFVVNGAGNIGEVATGLTLTLTLAVDDSAAFYVNGSNTGRTSNGWTKTSNVTLRSGDGGYDFKIGTNTLTIYVSNSGDGATGLLVSSIGANVPTPEVGAWMPIAGALFLLGWMRLRPKKDTISAAS